MVIKNNPLNPPLVRGNTKKQLYTLLLCLLSGLMSALAFPPLKTWVLIYPGMILLLFLITTSETYKGAMRRAYVTMLFFNLFTLYWISSWSSDDKFIKIGGIAVILVHPIFFLVPIIFYYLTYRNINLGTALILFPFFWTGFEYFHNLGQLAFPWIELGNSETYNLQRIQYIDYTGVHGITFLICSATSIIFYLIYKLNNREWAWFSSKSIIGLTGIVILIILPNAYSNIYLSNPKHKEYTDYARDTSNNIKAAVIQTNIDPWKKWTSNIQELVDSFIKKLEEAEKDKPDIIVLHETAAPYYFFSEYYAKETNKLINFTNSNQQNLLIGAPHLYYYTDSNSAPKDSKVMKGSGKRYDTFNSAVLLEPFKNKDEYTIYSKSRLVPFSERVPYQEYLPFLQDIIKWGVGISSWQIGRDTTIFKLKSKGKEKTVDFAVMICFESAFSEYVSGFAKKGAEFLIVITNDGWFGNSSGPYQHQQFSVLRAIENRKWIIRAAQTGISCFIDPLGNSYDKTIFSTENKITREIIANDEKTFYSENGDIIGKISYFVSVIMLIVNGIFYIKRRKGKENRSF